MPVIGINPIVMPIFCHIANNKYAIIPVVTIRPKISFELSAILIILESNNTYKLNKQIAPNVPHCSQTWVNIKSVWISGTYCDEYPPVPSLANEFKLPKNPPDPIAISDCLKW